jgi:hypothetical protein
MRFPAAEQSASVISCKQVPGDFSFGTPRHRDGNANMNAARTQIFKTSRWSSVVQGKMQIGLLFDFHEQTAASYGIQQGRVTSFFAECAGGR